MLAGVDTNFVTQLLEAGCDPTIATYDGGFMTNQTEVNQVQCRGRDYNIFTLNYTKYIFTYTNRIYF